ncbi:hypothetical protein [Streptomyces sp. NPDC093568]|uniref:ATP-binding protein n=1 Tax=Streptomyces sp. NPDC093568 TaxID=3366041 RepID=UPI0037FEA4B3
MEIAPAPGLDEAVRAGLHAAALRMAREAAYAGLGTFEFLVDTGEGSVSLGFKAQLRVTSGESLDRVGAWQAPVPRGCACRCG